MNKVAEIIQAHIEPTEPQGQILAFFKANEGKRLDKRFMDKLKAHLGRQDVRYDYIAGMTNIVWGNRADMTSKAPSGSLLVGYASEGSLVSDAAKLEDRNIAYFGAAVSRNEARQRSLADVAGQEEILALAEQLRTVKARLKEIFAYGTDFNHDEYSIRQALDIYEK